MPEPGEGTCGSVCEDRRGNRFAFSRWWSAEPFVTFVMHNPSIVKGSPIPKKCAGWVQGWNGILVGTKSLICTHSSAPKPFALNDMTPEIRSTNRALILASCLNAARVVFAWGDDGPLLVPKEIDWLHDALQGHDSYTLGVSSGFRQPCHPQRLHGALSLVPYSL
jgi:hypothetical protein